MIEAARLVLRAPEPRDLAWQLEWLNSAMVMRFLGGVRSLAAVTAAFERNVTQMTNGEPAFWTVVLRGSGEIVGKCGLSRIEEVRAPPEIRGAIQVGWSLAEPFWGQGLASEAARAALEHGFASFDAGTIWAQTSDSNAGSTRVIERLGFNRCPVFSYSDPDYPPRDNPAIVYRMERADWAARV